MELREIIAKLHQVQAQIKVVEAQEVDLKGQLETLENEIKMRLDASDEDYANLSEQEFQSLMASLGDPMKLTIEVVYATKSVQVINEVQIVRGASIEDSIIMSGMLDKCPDINLSINKVGIYGAVKPLSEPVSDGDRIEIYRPVTTRI